MAPSSRYSTKKKRKRKHNLEEIRIQCQIISERCFHFYLPPGVFLFLHFRCKNYLLFLWQMTKMNKRLVTLFPWTIVKIFFLLTSRRSDSLIKLQELFHCEEKRKRNKETQDSAETWSRRERKRKIKFIRIPVMKYSFPNADINSPVKRNRLGPFFHSVAQTNTTVSSVSNSGWICSVSNYLASLCTIVDTQLAEGTKDIHEEIHEEIHETGGRRLLRARAFLGNIPFAVGKLSSRPADDVLRFNVRSWLTLL